MHTEKIRIRIIKTILKQTLQLLINRRSLCFKNEFQS